MNKVLFALWIVITISWVAITIANIVAGEPIIRIVYGIIATLFGSLVCYTEYDKIKRG